MKEPLLVSKLPTMHQQSVDESDYTTWRIYTDISRMIRVEEKLTSVFNLLTEKSVSL